MLKYKKAFDKYAAKGERWGVFFYAGIGFVEPMVEGLKRCGKDLTRERFVKEMEGIRNFKGIFGRIDYSAFEPSDVYSRQGQKDGVPEPVHGRRQIQATDGVDGTLNS